MTRLRLAAGVLDLAARTAVVRGRRVRLSAREWALLAYLAERPGQAVSRQELLTEVWGYHPRVASRTVDTTVGRIRQKIERRPAEPDHLITVYGFGYRLDAARAPGTELVGREVELAELDGLIRRSPRVAVVGPPGVGKSRLIAAWAAGAGAGAGAGLVGDRAARVECAERPAVAWPAGRETLILDDADRVPDLAARLDAEPPERTIVVTSRRRPGARGEVALRLDGLSLEAGVTLFEQRARRIGAVGALERAEVEALVAHLDGLPLALEYAASRALLLPPAELVRRSLPALGGRGDDPRRETMIRAIGWTWDLLASWEQAAVSQLAVFEDGFTLAGLDAVLRLDGDPDPIDVLQSLVDRSLVRRRADGRWAVYTVLREFAEQRLTLHPQQARALVRHAEWALGLARALPPGDVGAARELVAAEGANLRAAAAMLDSAAAAPIDAALAVAESATDA